MTPGRVAAPLNNRYPSVANAYRVKDWSSVSRELALRALHKNRHQDQVMDIQSTGLFARPHSISPPETGLPKGARHVKNRAVFQHVITRAGEFVGDRFLGNHYRHLAALALVVALDARLLDGSIMRSLHNGGCGVGPA